MKTNNDRNIRVIAENKANEPGFHIYLDFSGQREYLTYHRHNGLLYGLLKDGAVLADMRRWKPSRIRVYRGNKRSGTDIYNVVNHLIAVIDDYLDEREAC